MEDRVTISGNKFFTWKFLTIDEVKAIFPSELLDMFNFVYGEHTAEKIENRFNKLTQHEIFLCARSENDEIGIFLPIKKTPFGFYSSFLAFKCFDQAKILLRDAVQTSLKANLHFYSQASHFAADVFYEIGTEHLLDRKTIQLIKGARAVFPSSESDFVEIEKHTELNRLPRHEKIKQHCFKTNIKLLGKQVYHWKVLWGNPFIEENKNEQ